MILRSVKLKTVVDNYNKNRNEKHANPASPLTLPQKPQIVDADEIVKDPTRLKAVQSLINAQAETLRKVMLTELLAKGKDGIPFVVDQMRRVKPETVINLATRLIPKQEEKQTLNFAPIVIANSPHEPTNANINTNTNTNTIDERKLLTRTEIEERNLIDPISSVLESEYSISTPDIKDLHTK
jgi:hypothetical protein